MPTRRGFLSQSLLGIFGMSFSQKITAGDWPGVIRSGAGNPIVISTWDHGLAANEAAWKILDGGGYALDAAEAGVRIPEADPAITTVGFGGYPDRDGKVTLDACIMDEKGNAGSVTFLEHIMHPVSVARTIMEKTPHVMLSGEGALKFAIENGFEKQNLLTPQARDAWKAWKKKDRSFKPIINIENKHNSNHDTIGLLCLDQAGRLCGACTTSGMAWKIHGRVGDSPIIGAGLFVDGEVGGAAATGTGELVMKTLGTFLVVEFMRNGLSPEEACRKAVARIVAKIPDYKNHQIGYIAINLKGETGAYCIQRGFNYAVKTRSFTGMKNSESFL